MPSEETEQSREIAEPHGAFAVSYGASPRIGGYTRLLLIEPDPSIRTRLTRQLQRATVDVLDIKQTDSLSAAVDYLRSNPVDAVITALKLPEASGGAIVRALHAQDQTLPIVLAIHRTEHAEMWAALSEGAEDFIDKGVRDGAMMLKTVAYAIERKATSLQLAYLARHDRLTGLANRELLYERLQRAIMRMERSGALVAVMALDLDHFKGINDVLGHGAGDDFLMAVSHRLKSCVRRTDTIARVGSDEFTIVIEGVENEPDVDSLCEKLAVVLSQPVPIRGQQISLTVSIGTAFWPRDGHDPNELLRNADTAMCRAKTLGGAQACRFDAEFNQTLNETTRLVAALREALADGVLQLYYQPKLSLQTGRLAGVEALLRWNHPELGEIPPGHFIPIAEENGLIVRIGEWVLRQACCDMRRWEALGFEDFSVAINLSPRQFSQGNFSVLVQQILEETAIDPNQLMFEITENVLMEDTELSRVQLDALKGLGVMVYLDDFGTGYSSLAYLKRFRIDGLKIDSSFVRDIGSDGDDTALTRAIIALGRALRLGVVAEGVETEAQLDFLREEGCDEVQGFLFSKALPYDEFVQWLSNSRYGELLTRVGTS